MLLKTKFHFETRFSQLLVGIVDQIDKASRNVSEKVNRHPSELFRTGNPIQAGHQRASDWLIDKSVSTTPQQPLAVVVVGGGGGGGGGVSTGSGFIYDSGFYSQFSSIVDDDWDPITQHHNVKHFDENMPSNFSLDNLDTPSDHWEAKATYFIIAVIFPLLMVFGTIGNMLTYVVLHRRTFTDK